MNEPNGRGLGVQVMIGKMPVPLKLELTVGALLKTFTPPDSKAAVLGVKITESVQLVPAAMVVPQVVEVCEKSAGLLPPVKEKDTPVASAVPVLEIVKLFTALRAPFS